MSKLVKRPWGTYTVLAKSKDFLLKKITVLGTPTKYSAVSGFDIEITGFENE